MTLRTSADDLAGERAVIVARLFPMMVRTPTAIREAYFWDSQVMLDTEDTSNVETMLSVAGCVCRIELGCGMPS